MSSSGRNRIVQSFTGRASIARLGGVLALVTLAVLGCDVHGVSGPGSLATIVVSPNPQTLAINGTQQFVATGTDFAGAPVGFAPTWSVVAGGGAISPTGVFTAGTAAGTYTATVKATNGSISATATVIVTVGALANIVVTPTPMSLSIGGTQQYVAVGTDAAGNVVPFTPTWSVVAGGGAINGAGMFTAGSVVGTFAGTVQASGGGIKGLATVTVTAGPLATITVTPTPATLDAGANQQFTATGADAAGNPVALTAAWSVVNGGGIINAASGLFTAGAVPGTYSGTVKATSGAISGTATVVVTPVGSALASITVTPNPANVTPNSATQFTAVGKDGNGNVIALSPVWSVVNGGGSISTLGLFTAGPTTGTFAGTVKATSGSISGTATVIVSVTPPVGALATITVTPNPASMQTSGIQQFSAVGKDVNGNIVPIVPLWTVANGGGSINSVTGFFQAGLVAGTYANTAKATSGSVSGTATVIVTAAPFSPVVNFGAAGPNGIMAGTAVTCVTGGIINADISISPGNTLSGFGPCVATGVKHLGDAVAAQAQIDLTTVYNTLFGLPCPPANAIVANLGGTTKAAGVYCSATTIGVTGTLTLDGGGDPNATFVFQAGTGLTTAGNVVLINGAQAKNVFWVVGSSATIGTASIWQGNIIALTSITLVDNATLNGRALARNGAVTLGTNNIITLP